MKRKNAATDHESHKVKANRRGRASLRGEPIVSPQPSEIPISILVSLSGTIDQGRYLDNPGLANSKTKKRANRKFH